MEIYGEHEPDAILRNVQTEQYEQLASDGIGEALFCFSNKLFSDNHHKVYYILYYCGYCIMTSSLWQDCQYGGWDDIGFPHVTVVSANCIRCLSQRATR